MSSKKSTPLTQTLWFKIFLGLITFGLYFLLRPSTTKKSLVREWSEAIVFAVIAATIIRTFFLEAFTIPTSSMEKTLLIGDFLFVSKVSYGARIPMTPLAVPFVHHTMPFTDSVKSYTTAVQLPYMRLPGLGKVKNNDMVVFNYPMEDFRPVDKQENYIKRCVAIPGDLLQVKDAVLYINNKAGFVPQNMQLRYYVKTDGSPLDPEALQKLGITDVSFDPDNFAGDYQMLTTFENAEKLAAFGNVQKVIPMVEPSKNLRIDPMMFPQSQMYGFNVDNFGPVKVPSKGSSVELNLKTLPIYKRIISVYEKNKLEVKDSLIFINGARAKSYTFKMDYYFMMGDNRHNSLDSRFWGFVPDDHIVGKAVFIWLSLDNTTGNIFKKIRWKRMFTSIGENGPDTKFLWLVVIGIAAFYGYNWYKNKKKPVSGKK